MNRRLILLAALVFVIATIDYACCITDANIKSAFAKVTKRGSNLTNIVLAISGLAAIGFAMFQEYGLAKGFAVGTGLFAGYSHFVGDGSACTIDAVDQFISANLPLIHQTISTLC